MAAELTASSWCNLVARVCAGRSCNVNATHRKPNSSKLIPYNILRAMELDTRNAGRFETRVCNFGVELEAICTSNDSERKLFTLDK